MGRTDALLAARLAAGDDHALAEVFDRLAPAVYGAVLRVLGNGAAAQDVVQDGFVELWSHPGRYDPAAGTLRTFLMVQARHRAVDVVRSELRRIARQERHHRLAPGQPPPSPCEEVTAAQAASAVGAAVRLLPDGQRRVVELAYFEGLTCREVALAAGIPEGTAKSRLRLALAKLETVLDRQLRLVLTGPGGGTWDVAIGERPPDPVSIGIITDAVGFCRLVANRVTPADLDLHVSGDPGRAAWVLAAASALALD